MKVLFTQTAKRPPKKKEGNVITCRHGPIKLSFSFFKLISQGEFYFKFSLTGAMHLELGHTQKKRAMRVLKSELDKNQRLL